MNLRRVRWSFRLILIALGAALVWINRQAMNPDGISYLDLARYATEGDWRQVVNAYWSPLYSLLLAVGLAIVRPEPAWVFPVAHGVNFVIYLIALYCFDRLLDELIAQVRDRALPVLLFGYTLFGWAMLMMIGLETVTPDLLVAALVLAVATEVLRAKPSTLRLGVLLGIGYLAKAPMLIFAVVACLALGRRGFKVAIIFLVCALPWVLALTLTKGRLTFGDSARLNYAMFVNRVQFGVHWQDANAARHPTRQIGDTPAVYEFAQPVGGSYPAWFDPSYWYEGVPVRFNWQQQSRALLIDLMDALETLSKQWPVLVGVLALFLLTPRGRFAPIRPLLLLGAVPLLTYLPVHLEPRFWAASNVLLWLAIIAGIVSASAARAGAIIAWVTAILMGGLLLVNTGLRPQPDNSPVQIATEIQRLGIQEGTGIGHIGYSFRAAAWAHLARVRIVVELPTSTPDDFWKLDATRQEQVLQQFAEGGVRVVIGRFHVKPPAAWRRLGATDHHYRIVSGSI